MSFHNLIMCIFFISILSVTGNTNLSVYKKMRDYNENLHKKKQSTYFISESFRNTCNGQGFNNLNEWQTSCKALWNLSYIGWSNIEEFMDINPLDNEIVFYGKWIGEYGEGEVYCKRGK